MCARHFPGSDLDGPYRKVRRFWDINIGFQRSHCTSIRKYFKPRYSTSPGFARSPSVLDSLSLPESQSRNSRLMLGETWRSTVRENFSEISRRGKRRVDEGRSSGSRTGLRTSSRLQCCATFHRPSIFKTKIFHSHQSRPAYNHD